MLESILLSLYACASIALALYVRRTFRVRLDWSHPDMRRPILGRQVRSAGGTGALGAADSISTAALSSASPSVVMMAIIVIAGLAGAVLGAGVLPALAGGIGHPNGFGLAALMVATLAWAYIGGCLALPLLVLALGLWPVIIGIGLFGFCAMAFWQTFNSGHPSPFDGNGKWQAAFGARVDYNLCAAGTSLTTVGNGAEVARKCKRQVVGPHPVEGRFAGVYSCGKGQRIAAVVDVRPFGPYRNGSKSTEFQFSDQPETMFPNGAFAGFVRPNGATSEFRSDGLAWTQKPGPGWGKPDQIAITAEPAGGISVRLLNTPCTTLQAQRCEPAEAGQVPACESELARQGVKLYVPRTLRELSQVIADQEARQGRAR